ncbi:MAG: FAD-dependent oxidoreductase [Gammaproteobacteria bacterium]
MERTRYDMIIIGGGLGGSVLAKTLAEDGARVLLLERDQQFRDRVRGEGMHAWGVPEAKALGVYELLRDRCGLEVPKWDMHIGHEHLACRDFTVSTPHGSPLFSFYHPDMQETLITAAAAAGAEVWRGAAVRHVHADPRPTVKVEHAGWTSDLHASWVVGADGRKSPTRHWMGFEVHQDPARRWFTGVLLGGVPLPEDTWYAVMNPDNGHEVFLGNIGQGRVRAYLGYPQDAGPRYLKPHDLPRMFEAAIATGADRALYAQAYPVGPIATFASDDVWVTHPFKDGVALIGDAAATCDPSFGQGLAMTLRSVRRLRDAMRSHADRDAAGHAYADAHQRDFQAIHRQEDWLREMFLDTSPAAAAQRVRALPGILADPARVPDLFGMGPDAASDETTRRRFFAEA